MNADANAVEVLDHGDGNGSGHSRQSAPARHRAGPGWSAPPRAVLLAVTGVLAVLAPLVATFDLDVPGRALLAVAFTVCVPGVPLALAAGLRDRTLTAALAVVSGPAWALLSGSAAVVGGWWAPVASAWVASAVAAVATPLALRARPGTEEPVRQWIARQWSQRPWSTGELPTRRSVRRPVPAVLAPRIVAALALVLAFGLWWSGAREVPLDDAGNLGLLPILGWRLALALVLLCAVVGWALTRPRPDGPLLVASALLLACVAYATVSVADGQGSVPTGWVHVAFADEISRTGTVPPSVDARFSWPGFFAAAAQLVTLAGVPDARVFLAAAPVFTTAALMPGLFVIARSITRSPRWAWVAVFCYLLTNWYQQDYFSPQAIAFTGYVTVLATALRLLDGATVPRTSGPVARRALQFVRRVPGIPAGESAASVRGAWLLVVLVTLSIAVGHQLTPIALLAQALVLTLTGLTRFRLLWLVTGIALAGWFAHGATDYWTGHLPQVLADIGQPGSSLNGSVGERLAGDPLYQNGQLVRMGTSAALFALAAVGLFVLRRNRKVVLLGALAVAPFGLLLVQSYGGEVLIRCFLYACPVLTALAAVALRWVVNLVLLALGRAGRPAVTGVLRAWAPVLVVPVLLVACLTTVFTRNLNASFERVPADQVQVSERMYQLARTGDAVGLPTGGGLTPYQRITEVSGRVLDPDACGAGPTAACIDQPPRFVMVSLTQDRDGQLVEGRTPGWVWRLADRWVATGEYRVVVQLPDAWLLERTVPTAPVPVTGTPGPIGTPEGVTS